MHVTVTEQNCPAKGQIYTQCGQDCVATCQNPLPTGCSQTCKPGCNCPSGTVLDEIQNTCVPLSKCSKSVQEFIIKEGRESIQATLIVWPNALHKVMT